MKETKVDLDIYLFFPLTSTFNFEMFESSI